MAFLVSSGSSKILFFGSPLKNSEKLITKERYWIFGSKSTISHSKSAWIWCPFLGSTPCPSLQVAFVSLLSFTPPGKSKNTHISIELPASIFWLAKPKNLKVILPESNLKKLTCLKDNFIFNFLSASFFSPLIQVNELSDLIPASVKISSFPSFTIVCSIIIGWSSISPPYLHSISTSLSAFEGGNLQMASAPDG